jgi:purine nucleosidase
MIKEKVIIDCDPGIDDMFAIRYALRSPKIEVLGFSVVSGNVADYKGVNNLKEILYQENRLDLPIHIGRGRPLTKFFRDAEDTHGQYGLGYFNAYHDLDKTVEPESASSFLLRHAECKILALGPLTNIADSYLANPELAQTFDIISMGGNLYAQGNMSEVSEYNYWVDPESAKLVLNHLKVTMVGLDVTRQLKFYPEDITDPNDLEILKFYFEFHQLYENFYGAVINDPLVVDYLLYPEDYACQKVRLDVITENGDRRGQTVISQEDDYHLNQAVLAVSDIEMIKARIKALVLNK